MAEPLRFEALRIRRMPGFEDEGFPLPDLSPGINLIHGPNGSGKTTTATAIHGLLWPRSAAALRPSLSGRFTLGGSTWSVDVEIDRAAYQRDGMVADPPLLPPAEERDRYRLSLHELLEADDARFAAAIQREAAGGYDLAGARAALPAAGTGSRRLKEVGALSRAAGELEEAVRAQRELHSSERDLSSLRTRRDEASAAARQVELLRLAITHAARRDAETAAREALAAHPPEMAEMRGDEGERLEEIRAELASLDAAIDRADEAIAAADAVIASAVPAEVDGGFVAAVRAELDALREAEREVAAAERARDGAAARLEAERRGIGEAVRDDLLAELDTGGAVTLSAFARRAADAHARVRALEAQIAALGAEEDTDPGAVQRLTDGVRILRAWLRCTEPSAGGERRERRLSIAAGAALVVGGLALWTVTPAALVLAVVGIAVLVAATSRAEVRSDGPGVHRSEYERLGLEPPASWDAPSVERLLAELESREAEAVAALRRSESRRTVEHELARAREALRPLEAERLALVERLGVEPALDEAALLMLVERVDRWQAARAATLEAESALVRARGQVDSLAAAARDRIAPHSTHTPPRLADLLAALQRLDESRRSRDEALRDRRAAEASRVDHLERRARCRDSLRALYERAGVPDGDADALLRRCEAHAEYREARQDHDDRKVAAREARDRLLERGGSDDLLERPRDALEAALSAAEAAAASLRDLDDRVREIELRVADAKRLHDIEARLAEVERLKDELRDVRERDARGAIADLLVEHVRREAREEQLPAVFLGARELFGRITRGRYTLELTDGPEPEFRAIDNVARRGRSLDQLSSGTRVQLLLAVRVAFVERLEAEARLPLVLDEVLGNSDDERAGAIMDAVVELAADGRQVFYFTAQSDEVQKWGATLAAHGSLPWLAIDLADATRAARTVRIRDLHVAPPRASVPPPDGRSHAAYAELLGVPAIDVASGHAGGLHLWYLIPDPDALYEVLQRGTAHWGELDGLVRSVGTALVDPAVHARAAALAHAADAWFDASRIGAGRTLDRAALLTASGITDTFRDPVDQLRQRVSGDARLLIAAMESGEIKGFRKNKLDEFREFLAAEGYVDTREPLSDAEIRNRVIASVASELERGALSLSDVDALIARLAAGAAG